MFFKKTLEELINEKIAALEGTIKRHIESRIKRIETSVHESFEDWRQERIAEDRIWKKQQDDERKANYESHERHAAQVELFLKGITQLIQKIVSKE